MGKNRTNPRRVPRTQADVERAEAKGQLFGMEFMAVLTMWILIDKHNAPDEDVQQFNEEIKYLCEYLCDSIEKGYVSYPDIRRALDEEHGTKVVFR